MAQWYDVNRSQRLALDALSEAERIDDWFKRGIVLADAAAVLAISGENTVNMSSEKFDEATELALRFMKKDPIRASSLMARIAYDKAFTKFYMDSDKLFYESVVIPLEAVGLSEALPTIMRILRLASKAKYFYVIYEVAKDWLLPMIDGEKNMALKAKYLSLCANAVLPVSIGWSANIAKEALSLVKSLLDAETLPLYYGFYTLSDPLAYAMTLLDMVPTLANTAYILPRDSTKLLRSIISVSEKLMGLYARSSRRRIKKWMSNGVLAFLRRLGTIVASLKHCPKMHKAVEELASKFMHNARNAIRMIYGVGSPEQILLELHYAYGLSGKDIESAVRHARGVLEMLFKYENNMWVLRSNEYSDLLRRPKGVLCEIMWLLTEIAFRDSSTLKDTIMDILIDLSEAMDQKTYTIFLISLIEKIRRPEIARELLQSIFNVLIDEGKITKKYIPKKFYEIVDTIDPMLARFIVEEIP